ncbi:glutamine--tRNA ligase/YqeY domain fusion protein [Alcanivorax sp. 1008]|uniref:glutamine--tRNA ligase/YqeY domain fusion protein n=1 Tax=Alcanivorax sp. 1008 TaxID=2816853 RepID=UPI001DAE0517|nr:glutamine--tRNA ligase/YqeY domain fusion protein [Alcanivorax sp. 1008]MCC1497904.1 glutamine--tRNA ligase/YqeY domain fusion protein [Alcanivorax sp. 1008]
MTDQNAAPTNFIRQLIDRDLAEGRQTGVVTRFPPEPNGYLHIGHAKSICLNFGLARDYQGQCNLRFDDTNPEKESEEYVDAITRDVSWLGFEWAGEIRYASSYFDQIHDCAVELINKGLAYVDELNAEQMREYRGTLKEPGKPSPFRDRSVAENLEMFGKMRAGQIDEGAAVLRAKIDMASPNMNMRDPVLYRVRKVHHHQTGDKWCIYPMYDFTHPISDALEGVTHSLCTLEFEAHRPLYDWVIEHCTLPAVPKQTEFARLNLNYTVTSKRKLKQLVDEGHVSGWDDPRMPTIAGLRRRGYTPASLRKFCDMVGVARADSTVDMAMLESAIRDDLNQNAPRAFCVLRPLKVVIENWDADKVEILNGPVHPQNDDMGTRPIPMTREVWIDREDFLEEANKKYKRLVLGDEVRLRYGYVIRANKVIRDASGEISEIRCSYDPDTLGKNPEGRKVRGVIHWVSASRNGACEVRQYDRLFTEANPDKVEEGKTFLDTINPQSLTVFADAVVEESLAGASVGQGFQFEREGYYAVDPDSSAGKLVFNLTVGLRESF